MTGYKDARLYHNPENTDIFQENPPLSSLRQIFRVGVITFLTLMIPSDDSLKSGKKEKKLLAESTSSVIDSSSSAFCNALKSSLKEDTQPVVNPAPSCNIERVHLILSDTEISDFAKATYLLRDGGQLFKNGEVKKGNFLLTEADMSQKRLDCTFSNSETRSMFFQNMPTEKFKTGIQEMRTKYLRYTSIGRQEFPHELENFQRIFLEKNQECSQQFLEIQRNADFHKRVIRILRKIKANPEKWFHGKFDPMPYINFVLNPENNVIFVSSDLKNRIRHAGGRSSSHLLPFGKNFYRLISLEDPHTISVLFQEIYHAMTMQNREYSNIEIGEEEITSGLFSQTLENILQEPDSDYYQTLRANPSDTSLTLSRIAEVIDSVYEGEIMNIFDSRDSEEKNADLGVILESLTGHNPCPAQKYGYKRQNLYIPEECYYTEIGDEDWCETNYTGMIPFLMGWTYMSCVGINTSIRDRIEKYPIFFWAFNNALMKYYREEMEKLGINF
ncbi:hypothetical protein TI05_15365 [Achromatium sp. WMS3]|nr:hypothetical protein TI05_15365 [Achromatium sp. WMS3]